MESHFAGLFHACASREHVRAFAAARYVLVARARGSDGASAAENISVYNALSISSHPRVIYLLNKRLELQENLN